MAVTLSADSSHKQVLMSHCQLLIAGEFCDPELSAERCKRNAPEHSTDTHSHAHATSALACLAKCVFHCGLDSVAGDGDTDGAAGMQ